MPHHLVIKPNSVAGTSHLQERRVEVRIHKDTNAYVQLIRHPGSVRHVMFLVREILVPSLLLN